MRDFARKFTSSVAIFIAGAVVATITSSYIASVNANSTRIAQVSKQDSKMVSIDQERQMRFELKGCNRVNQKLSCNFLLTNLASENRQIVFYGSGYSNARSRMIDDSGNEYSPLTVQVGGQVGSTEQQTYLIPGVPMKVVLTFKVPPQVSNLSVIEAVITDYSPGSTGKSNFQIKDISLGNSTGAANKNCENSTPATTTRRKR